MSKTRTIRLLGALAATFVAVAILVEFQTRGRADEATIDAGLDGVTELPGNRPPASGPAGLEAVPGEDVPGEPGGVRQETVADGQTVESLATQSSADQVRRLPPVSPAGTSQAGNGSSLDDHLAFFSRLQGSQTHPSGRVSHASWNDDSSRELSTLHVAESNVGRSHAAVLPSRPQTADDGHTYENDLPTPHAAEPVSLHLNEVDVRQALEMLSRSHNINMLVGPSVSGSVTANLEGLDANTALNAILKLCSLVAHRENGLIYIYAATEYPQIDFQVQTIALDYAAGTDVLPIISSLLSPNGQAFSTEIDPLDNSKSREAIAIVDMPRVIQRAVEYIRQVDIPPLQVMIEAHVLQVNLTDDCRHGINYNQVMQSAGNSGVAIDVVGFADPTASPSVFAHLTSKDVDALLEFLKETTDSKTLASPRVMVINGQTAKIQVGEQIPYNVVTVTETSAIEEVRFLDVGVVLEVTPRISQDGRVMMRVKPKVSEGKFSPGTDLPGEETREIQSDVLIRDGEAVVIGGLIQEKLTDVQIKVPYLGDLHYIGRLFQKRQRVKQRTEVVITLIPRIQYADGSRYERDLIDAERSQTPLLHQPLDPVYRPWELPLPDAVYNPLTWQQFRAEFPPIHRRQCRNCGPAPCNCPNPGQLPEKPAASGELMPPALPTAARAERGNPSAGMLPPGTFHYSSGTNRPPPVLVDP